MPVLGVDYYRIRAKRVRALIRERFDDSYTDFSAKTGIAESTISRWFMTGSGHKNIGEIIARRIEDKLKLDNLWLDQPEEGSEEKGVSAPHLWPFSPTLLKAINDYLTPDQLMDLEEIIEDRVTRIKERSGAVRRKKSND